MIFKFEFGIFEKIDLIFFIKDFFAQCVRSRLYVRRMPEGTGLSGHRVVISICQMIGIKDLHCKVEGNTRNYLAITKAFFTGLRNQENFQQLAQRTQLHVVEFRRENGFRYSF